MKTETKNQLSALFFALLIAGMIFCITMIVALLFKNPIGIYWTGGSLAGIAYMAVYMIYYESKETAAQKFFKAKEKLFEHVGFKPDWVEYAIDDCTEMHWLLTNGSVKFAKTLKALYDESDGEYYMDSIYTQRFYKQWVYRGKDVTMIFCNPGVDGIMWFKVFDNKKEQK